MQDTQIAGWVNRYKIRSMRYDHNRMRATGGEIHSDMSDWGGTITNGKGSNQYQIVSPPSSRYGGEDDASSTTQSRPRRSRLDNDIQEMPVMYPRPQSSRKSLKNGNGSTISRGHVDPNMIKGRRSVGHNSTFNGYDLHANYSRSNYSMSGRYPSSYASDYLKSRGGVGVLPNKMMDPRRPRSTAAEKYSDMSRVRNGYESYSTSGEEKKDEEEDEDDDNDDEEDDEEEEMRNYYLQAQRAQGSRSVNTTITQDPFMEGGEAYYFGVIHMDLELIAHVKKTIPPPPGYYELPPIERVAYVFYCAVYKKPYANIEEFHKVFNKEFYKFVCDGDSNDLALFKICKSMQEQHRLKQLEESKRAYEKAQKEAAEASKLDFNQQRETGEENHVSISQPEEVLNYGPMKFHTGHAFASFGIGGKLVVIRPAGSVDPITGQTFSTANVAVEDLRSMIIHDDHSSKIIELVQSFKGPLIPGQTPGHSVRLYIQRQIDALKIVEKNGDVKKSEVIDALLVWQLLEIMVQQHGRISGPDVATLLTNASEQLAEKTGVAENSETSTSTFPTSPSKLEARERFNKFLLGGHVNEAIESAISDGLYADAMTLIRRLYPNDSKKIEDIESRFLHLRSVDDPYATLVAVASGQPPPILTNSAFDDDNNWKRHAAIILANLTSPTAMQTIYHLGLMLSKRERHCAADFCLLVVCVLAAYDPFLPLGYADGEQKSRKHIGLIHSGSHLINKIDGLSEIADFSFVDLHATDIFDYALRLPNPQLDTPLSKSKEYQKCRIEYTKKISSYGGFATDSFRYCTEVARSLWPHVSMFEKEYLLDVCDLAENLQYVSAAPVQETEWIQSLRMMIGEQPTTEEVSNLHSEAQNWHDEHQTPIDISKNVQETMYQEEAVVSTTETILAEDDSVTLTESSVSAQESLPPPPPPVLPPPAQVPVVTPPPVVAPPPMTLPPSPPPPIVRQPIDIPTANKKPPKVEAKSPRSELEDLWGAAEPMSAAISAPPPAQPPTQMARPVPPAPSRAVPTTQPQVSYKEKEEEKSSPNIGQDRKSSSSSRGWFGSIREKVIKSIPSNNAMILPDDSKPAITWDPVTKKYIGAGVEEEIIAPPPPTTMLSAPSALPQIPTDSAKSSTNSLRSARGTSRYLKATGIAAATSGTTNGMMPPPPDMTPNMMPLPTSFGFIPTAVDDDENGSYVDPFSSEPTNATSLSSSSSEQPTSSISSD